MHQPRFLVAYVVWITLYENKRSVLLNQSWIVY